AQALHTERSTDHKCPSNRMFKRLCKKLGETGSLVVRKNNRKNSVTSGGNKINFLAIVNRYLYISARQIEHQSRTSRSDALQPLARCKFHPNDINLHQKLHGIDLVNRVTFVQRGA
ncbi:hypothetical protein WH47_01695, partial [Habropoda laboriosa]